MGKLYTEKRIWFPKFFSAIVTQNMLFSGFLQEENEQQIILILIQLYALLT